MITNKKIKKKVFTEKNNGAGIKDRKEANSNQPPTNRITVIAHIKMMLLYSAKKKRAKPMAEYSTLYPETSSASASGRSKGCRLVSASVVIKNSKKVGNKGVKNHTYCWFSTMSEKLRVPAIKITERSVVPIGIS
jgi:hypothetical protein